MWQLASVEDEVLQASSYQSECHSNCYANDGSQFLTLTSPYQLLASTVSWAVSLNNLDDLLYQLISTLYNTFLTSSAPALLARL